MIIWLATGLLAAFLLLMLLNWWANADTTTAKSSILVLIIALCTLLSVALIAMGKGILALIPSGYALFRLLAPYAGRALFRKATSGRQNRGAGQAQRPGDPSAAGSLNRTEALDVLGLEEGAGQDEILAAYKRLMAQVHPDKGGSDWMAAKLNDARRILLDEE